MRHANPEKGAITRATVRTITAADYMPFSFIGVISSITFILVAVGVAADGDYSLGCLFLIPGLLPLAMLMIFFAGSTKTSDSSYYREDNVGATASVLFDQIRGGATEQLALPIAQKIFAHAREGQHNHFGECFGGQCGERIEVLRQLVPAEKSITSATDIEAARRYLELVAIEDKRHKQYLKELGE